MKNYVIKMMSGEKYTISEETRNGLAGASGLCHLREIDTMINLSSVSTITPEDKANETEKTLFDGTKAVFKNGTWVDRYSGVRLDTGFYTELIKRPKEFGQNPYSKWLEAEEKKSLN